MNIEYLREYVCLAEELNFSRAANRLYLSQSALSKHLVSLEREFGARSWCGVPTG